LGLICIKGFGQNRKNFKLGTEDLTTFRKDSSDHAKIFDAIMVSTMFLSVCWALFLMDRFLGYHIRSYGMYPRTPEGLYGVVTMHFLHGDLKHIAQNSLGFLVLNSFVFYFYRKIAFKVFAWLFFLAPLILWVTGRPSNHIGASLLIYGEFAFLCASGFIRKNPLLLRVALAVIFYYGSLVWYLFPIDARISWEGHASGFAIGVLAAYLYRNKGPQRKKYLFESEPELPDDENAYWKIPPPTPKEETTVTIKYHYKERG
jgi:membrane associated rhomboid family serine protease